MYFQPSGLLQLIFSDHSGNSAKSQVKRGGNWALNLQLVIAKDFFGTHHAGKFGCFAEAATGHFKRGKVLIMGNPRNFGGFHIRKT